MKKLIFLLLLLASPLEAVTRYIDNGSTGCSSPTDTDYTPGTRTCGAGSDRVYNSLASALSGGLTVAGDVLDIRAGTYNEGINTNTQTLPSGSSFSVAVTIRAHVGETVIFQSSAEAVFNIVGTGGVPNSYIIFDRLIVDGASQAIGGTGGTISIGGASHHLRFQDCEIRNAANVNVFSSRLSGVGHEFLRNKLYGGGRDGLGYGIYVESDGVIFRGNDVYGNAGYGIHFYNGHPSGDMTSENHIIDANNIHDNIPGTGGIGGCAIIDGSNNLYTNNICNTNSGSIGIDASDFTSGSGNQIYNNTIAHNGAGIRIGPNFSGTIVKNNIVRTHNNLTGTITNNGEATSFAKNLGCIPTPPNGPNCYSSANPDFVTFPTNLRTQLGSPVRGQGEDLSLIFTTDFEGTTRTGTWDIGAYESAPLVTNITLASPDGGESWAQGSIQSITYSYSNVANVDIAFDPGNDGNFEVPVATNTTANGSYAWTVPNTPTQTGKIRVKDSASATQDISAAVFEIKSTAGGPITVIISDNTSGTIGTITGTTNALLSQAAPTTNYPGTIGIRANKGTANQFSYSLIKFPTATIPSNSTVTAAQLGLYLTGYTNVGAVSIDFRNNKRNFVQTEATYNFYSGTIAAPNNWATPGGLGTADRDSAIVCNMSIAETPLNQYYTCSSAALTSWVQSLVNLGVPNNGLHLERFGSGLDGLVRVFGSNHTSTASDQRPYLSVTYTTTAATISVVEPTSRDSVFPSRILTVRWTSQGMSGNVRLLLSRDNGLTYPETVVSSVAYNSPDYTWTATPGRSDNCKIKVVSLNDTNVFGESATFTIRGRTTRFGQ